LTWLFPAPSSLLPLHGPRAHTSLCLPLEGTTPPFGRFDYEKDTFVARVDLDPLSRSSSCDRALLALTGHFLVNENSSMIPLSPPSGFVASIYPPLSSRFIVVYLLSPLPLVPARLKTSPSFWPSLRFFDSIYLPLRPLIFSLFEPAPLSVISARHMSLGFPSFFLPYGRDGAFPSFSHPLSAGSPPANTACRATPPPFFFPFHREFVSGSFYTGSSRLPRFFFSSPAPGGLPWFNPCLLQSDLPRNQSDIILPPFFTFPVQAGNSGEKRCCVRARPVFLKF